MGDKTGEEKTMMTEVVDFAMAVAGGTLFGLVMVYTFLRKDMKRIYARIDKLNKPRTKQK